MIYWPVANSRIVDLRAVSAQASDSRSKGCTHSLGISRKQCQGKAGLSPGLGLLLLWSGVVWGQHGNSLTEREGAA